jgi:hypothetical protein
MDLCLVSFVESGIQDAVRQGARIERDQVKAGYLVIVTIFLD